MYFHRYYTTAQTCITLHRLHIHSMHIFRHRLMMQKA